MAGPAATQSWASTQPALAAWAAARRASRVVQGVWEVGAWTQAVWQGRGRAVGSGCPTQLITIHITTRMPLHPTTTPLHPVPSMPRPLTTPTRALTCMACTMAPVPCSHTTRTHTTTRHTISTLIIISIRRVAPGQGRRIHVTTCRTPAQSTAVAAVDIAVGAGARGAVAVGVGEQEGVAAAAVGQTSVKRRRQE